MRGRAGGRAAATPLPLSICDLPPRPDTTHCTTRCTGVSVRWCARGHVPALGRTPVAAQAPMPRPPTCSAARYVTQSGSCFPRYTTTSCQRPVGAPISTRPPWQAWARGSEKRQHCQRLGRGNARRRPRRSSGCWLGCRRGLHLLPAGSPCPSACLCGRQRDVRQRHAGLELGGVGRGRGLAEHAHEASADLGCHGLRSAAGRGRQGAPLGRAVGAVG